ncbi:hypothetical protein E0K93_20670 [Puniceibacterium sp. HSS470]|uniref:hypothetical protein n=1 Tax=Pseudooceanicola sediminis TaxID=2211117 RepID=UPI0011C46AFB|nr:hypothetical protein [Pseudooceanicola sediminis]KAA2311407.1 hypothetical protein E0K93_20670 [Puniceibacterium sp. HSS470]
MEEDISSAALKAILDDRMPAFDSVTLYPSGRRQAPPALGAVIHLLKPRSDGQSSYICATTDRTDRARAGA